MLKKIRSLTILVVVLLTSTQSMIAQWERVYGCRTDKYTQLFENNNTLMISTNGFGIYKLSADETCWIPQNNGLENSMVNVLCESDNGILAGTDDGIFFSSDNGNQWNYIYPSFSDIEIKTINVSENLILVGTKNSGLFLSENSGQSWMELNFPIQDKYINRVLFDNNTIYLTLSHTVGILKSTDFGVSWIHCVDGLPDSENVIDFNVNGDLIMAVFYNDLYRSTDAGESWSRTIISDISIPYSFIYFDQSVYYLGSLNNIKYSNDLGITWNHLSTIDGTPNQLKIIGDKCFIGSGNMIKSAPYSTNISSWDNLTSFIKTALIPDLLFADNYLFAGSYRSTDFGVNWKALSNYTTNSSPNFIDVANDRIYVAYGNELSYSTNYGDDWVLDNKGISSLDISFVKYYNNRFFAGTRTEGLFRKDTLSNLWIKLNLGDFFDNVGDLTFFNNLIVAGTIGSGVVVSADTGNTWESFNNGINSGVMNCFYSNGNALYVGTNFGVMKYDIETAMWTGLYGLGTILNPSKINDLNMYNGILCAATHQGFYYLKKTTGEWFNACEELSSENIRAVEIVGDEVYIGTSNKGLYKSKASEIFTDIKEENNLKPVDFILNQNYPNPFNPSTTISFSIPKNDKVTLKIFDILGREVATLYDEDLPAGAYSKIWTAGGFSSGVYFYRIKTSTFCQTKKMVLLQ